jgi:hypothetical protein
MQWGWPQFLYEACAVLLSYAVMPPDMPVVEPGSAFCVNSGVALNEVCTLTENICHYHDCVVCASGSSMMKSMETVSQLSSSTKFADWDAPQSFGPATKVTGGDILADMMGHLEVLLPQITHFMGVCANGLPGR